MGQESSGVSLEQFFESVARGSGGTSRYQQGAGTISDAGTGLRAVATPSIIPSRYTGEGGGRGSSQPSALPFEECREDAGAWLHYQEILKKRIYNNWTNPPEVEGKHVVVLSFTLDRGGTARNIGIVSATDQRVAENAVTAMKRSSPFPPIPEGLRCLAGEPLSGTFHWPREE